MKRAGRAPVLSAAGRRGRPRLRTAEPFLGCLPAYRRGLDRQVAWCVAAACSAIYGDIDKSISREVATIDHTTSLLKGIIYFSIHQQNYLSTR